MIHTAYKMGIALVIGLNILFPGICLSEQKPLARPVKQTSAPGFPPLSTHSDCYGDPLPPMALARLGSVRLRHPDNTSFQGLNQAGLVVFSHDGKSLFTTTGLENALRQWDVATGKLIRQFHDKSQRSKLVVPSPDGSTLATCGQDGQVLLWDIATGKLRHQWTSNVIALKFSPDGKSLMATCRNHLNLRVLGILSWFTDRVWWLTDRVWDTVSGKELQAQAIGSVDVEAQVLVLSPTEKSLALIGQKDNRNQVQLWKVATGKKLYQLPDLNDSPFFDSSSSMAFSVDGRFLATCSASETSGRGGVQRTDGAVRLWDVSTGKEVRQIASDKSGTSCVAFSPDGKILATGSMGGFIRLWEVATGKRLGLCRGYRSHIVSLTFSADGKYLASGASGNDQVARIWDVATGKEITSPLGGHTSLILSLNFTPDGESLISGGRDGRVCVWDLKTKRERRPHFQAGDYQVFTALSADGTSLASIGNVFAANGGPYDRTILTSPTVIRLWDMATGQEKRRFPASDGCAQSMAISPDGKSLLTVHCTCAGAVPTLGANLWDVATGKQRGIVHHNTGGVMSWMNAAFSPDNKIYAVRSGDDSLSLYGVATGKRLDHCKGSEYDPKFLPNFGSLGMTFSSDAQKLAAVGVSIEPGQKQSQLAICLWQLGSGQKQTLEECRRITGHNGKIFTLAYSPDGKTVASAGENGTIHVWETVTGKERCRFTGHHGQVWCLAFHPDGRRLASGSTDTTILIWDVTGRLDQGQLRPAQLSAQTVEKLWADLASSEASQAGQAIWSLVEAPEATVAFLRKQLVPIPVVRGLEQRIAQLIKQLDDDTFRARKQAVRELTKLGEAAEPALRQVLASSASSEAKSGARQLLKALEQKKTNTSNEDYRRIRALEILEQCGTLAARQLLESLAQGEPTASLTREAQASLARLSRRSVQQP